MTLNTFLLVLAPPMFRSCTRRVWFGLWIGHVRGGCEQRVSGDAGTSKVRLRVAWLWELTSVMVWKCRRGMAVKGCTGVVVALSVWMLYSAGWGLCGRWWSSW